MLRNSELGKAQSLVVLINFTFIFAHFCPSEGNTIQSISCLDNIGQQSNQLSASNNPTSFLVGKSKISVLKQRSIYSKQIFKNR